MRNAFTLLVALFACFLFVGTGAAANGDNLRLINADTNGTACGDSSGGFKVGVGLAFDGTNLLVSCYNDSTVTAVRPSDGSQVAIHHITGAMSLGALAWDNGRSVLWACSNFNMVGTIDLTTNVYTPKFAVGGCFDGLAYDGSDDSLWTSPDATSVITHSTASGVALGTFFPSLGGCGNSGIAVGGPLLYLANDGCSQIYTSPKDFSTPPALFATFPARLEDMECDNVTFAPSGAIWSKDAYDNKLNAWEIPAGSCLFGGGRSDLSLSPPSGDNPVGSTHTVTATLSDNHGPVSGGHILFDVSGANTAHGDGTTSSAGTASFSYMGLNAGDDTIVACYDKNNNNHCDPDEATATATKHWHVANADISVVKTGPSLTQDGSDVTYGITASNAGPADASNVQVTDAIPAGTTYVSSSAGCAYSAGVVTCSAATLASGASTSFSITVHVSTAATSVSNTATGTSDNPDPNPTNNSSTVTTTVNHAPSCDSLVANGPDMWPPNHKFRTFTVSGGSDPDGNTLTLAILDVRQDEPINGLGSGDTAPDAVIVDPTHVMLRGERAGTLDGRVYYITVGISDGMGGSCTGTVTVGVPHDQGPHGGPVGQGPLYSSLS